jgi:hypothetical protein
VRWPSAGRSGKLGSMPAQDLAALRAFRTALHGCFHRRADALFELGDAFVAAETMPWRQDASTLQHFARC